MDRNGLILGIEGGGTKTTWTLVRGADVGQGVAAGRAGAGNVSLMSDAALRSLLEEIRAALPSQPSRVGGAFAGVMSKTHEDRAERVVREVFLEAERVVVREDSYSALYAAHPDGEGIAVIAGTGCNVLGRHGDRVVRVAGWGHIIGDPGSAWDIAKRGLVAAYRAYDETGVRDALGTVLCQACGADSMEELIVWVMDRSSGKTEIAGLAEIIFDAEEAGIPLAARCIAEANRALAEFVAMAARRLNGERPAIGLIGGLFEKRAKYRELFETNLRALFETGRIFVAQDPGEIGAARMVARA